MFQFEIYNVVATMGTAVTNDQIKKLYYLANKLVFCYDGDQSGKKANCRTLDKVLSHLTDNRKLKFVFLPDGQDPDSLIRKIGRDNFLFYIKKAKSFTNLLFKNVPSNISLSNIDNCIELSKKLFPLINKIPGKYIRLFLYRYLNLKLGISNYENFINNLRRKIINRKKITKLPDIKNKVIFTLIVLLVQKPNLSLLVPNLDYLKPEYFPGLSIFYKLVRICKNFPGLNTAQLIENFRGKPIYPRLGEFAVWDHMISEDIIEEVFIDYLEKLYENALKFRQTNLIWKDRFSRLTDVEKKELWLLNKALARF